MKLTQVNEVGAQPIKEATAIIMKLRKALAIQRLVKKILGKGTNDLT